MNSRRRILDGMGTAPLLPLKSATNMPSGRTACLCGGFPPGYASDSAKALAVARQPPKIGMRTAAYLQRPKTGVAGNSAGMPHSASSRNRAVGETGWWCARQRSTLRATSHKRRRGAKWFERSERRPKCCAPCPTRVPGNSKARTATAHASGSASPKFRHLDSRYDSTSDCISAQTGI